MSLFSGARYAGPSGCPGASGRSERRRHGLAGGRDGHSCEERGLSPAASFYKGSAYPCTFSGCCCSLPVQLPNGGHWGMEYSDKEGPPAPVVVLQGKGESPAETGLGDF